MTMGTWIKIKFGTHAKLNEALGLGKNTVNRWYNHDPKRFLMYLPELSKQSETDTSELLSIIEGRVDDVKSLKSSYR